ncbi:hypothetical protein [Nocardia brevicatena]|nr:hypothetical protein [Nocardia brevicatena]
MTLPRRTALPSDEKGRTSFLHCVPHSIILTRIVEHLRAQLHAPEREAL